MGYQERQEIIREIQSLRGSRIVSHINSDRRHSGLNLPALQTKLATEAQPFFYKALLETGKHLQYDLFLYTSGGQTDSVWPLVSLFREYAELFNVLVPFKAHSAGTLVCLGANHVIMGETGELSPVDPQTGNQFNPINEINPRERVGISVEEASSYFDFFKNIARDVDGDDPPEIDPNLVFRILAEKVHPLALGGVNRSHKQIRELSRRLLGLHSDSDSAEKEKKIEDIVNTLTEGRFSHADILNRHEARTLLGENKVKFADENEQALMWRLFEQYSDAVSMTQPFTVLNEMGDKQQADFEIVGAFIETEKVSYVFRSIVTVIQRSKLPPNFNVTLQPGQLMPLIPGFPREAQVEMKQMGWTRNERGI